MYLSNVSNGYSFLFFKIYFVYLKYRVTEGEEETERGLHLMGTA